MRYIIYPDQAHSGPVGGKVGALAALRLTGLPIPAWFVLSPDAFFASLSQTQAGSLSRLLDSPDAWSWPADLTPGPAVQTELTQALARLCPNDELVAVRSSALDEDGRQQSFAGQLDSYLFVPPEAVAGKVAAVWRSGFSERVLAYRREHNLAGRLQPPAVLIQRMVNAEVAGVAFSADPVGGQRDIAVVAAVRGVATGLVSGAQDAETYHVDREGVVIRREPAAQPVLGEVQVQAVAALARQTEQFFGSPQDIEWAIEVGQLYLLQARPITALPRLADSAGAFNLWDNSNIAESYPGLSTPLTFSFARRAYEEVYRQFCRMMGVSETVIAGHHHTFRHMLGYIRGRIYYNLLSWHRVLALLPGYTFNRDFMEQMMGVKERLPAELITTASAPTRLARWQDGLRLLRTVAGLITNYVRLPRRIDHFYQRLDDTLGRDRPDLEPLRPDELVAYYRKLEGQLLTHWDAPLINDFFAMIFYGVLRKLVETWCDDPHGSLQNDLLADRGGMISAEPAARLREMAHLAADEPDLVTALCEGPLAQILGQLAQKPALAAKYQAYLDKFGNRCLEELKLESPTLHDDPLILLRSIGRLARHTSLVVYTERADRNSTSQKDAPETTLSQQAEQRVQALLARRPLRQIIFKWVLSNARRRVRDRENLRFERTRVFGRVRLIFTELGHKLQALDLLAAWRDIFYLEVEEVFGFVEGTTTTTDLKGLAALRRAEFERQQSLSPPADRFETRGMVHYGNRFDGPDKLEASGGDSRQGVGCCPGLVRGRARVIIDPQDAELQPGDILVARRTDPGWIMLFPAAAGLLVEHGSLLSHSAIVARELGLPAVVSLKDATRWLRDGDWVEFDGRSGLVRKLPV